MQAITILGVTLLAAQTAFGATPIKALIIDGQNNHDWKATTPVLKKILEDTKMFQVDVLTTPPKGGDFSDFNPDFSKYQVVVGNYNEFPSGDKWPGTVMSAFEQYVRGGGSYVSYHAADNAFPEWKAYNLMIGIGGWMGRNEKAGPFWYYKDGKLVERPHARECRQSWRADAVPGGDARHQASDLQGTARAVDARRRRTLFEDARTRREHGRAGDCHERSGEQGHRA